MTKQSHFVITHSESYLYNEKVVYAVLRGDSTEAGSGSSFRLPVFCHNSILGKKIGRISCPSGYNNSKKNASVSTR
jgi:hypothetical protein